jgi:putative membrane protein
MEYLYLKALHIIFIVTWFAGLFYIVRLFIYHTEAQQRDLSERLVLQNQFKIMERRLWYGITWPSMILTLIFGPLLLQYFWPITDHPWLLIKLGFIALLVAYHFQCHFIFKNLQKDIITKSSTYLRILNEVATVYLIAIVFLVMLKTAMSMVWGIIGLLIFSGLIMIAIKIYKNIRLK